jgi:hypothetical protein
MVTAKRVGDEDREDSDFLAVIDLARQGDRYVTIVATTPIGQKSLRPQKRPHGETGNAVPHGTVFGWSE